MNTPIIKTLVVISFLGVIIISMAEISVGVNIFYIPLIGSMFLIYKEITNPTKQ